MIQWSPNLQTEDAFHGQLESAEHIFEGMDINENQVRDIQRAYWMSSSGSGVFGKQAETGSKPKHNWECDAITDRFRTAAMLWDFQEKATSMEQGGHFPE